MFLELPSREDLPDYYDVIENPVDLNTIYSRIESRHYCNWEQFERDVCLVFSNAKRYNMEGSRVYRDAQALEQVFQAQSCYGYK